jgi:SAM-dependent methyltransferase
MSTVISHKERQKTQWSGAAAAWDRRFEWYSRAFGPLIEWCCDAARLAPGARVLDVACGAGQPAFAAASRVGPSGRVTAVDLSPQMIEAGARRARAAGVDTIAFVEMDAEDLRFPDASFDAITCACGLMFLSDAERVAASMRRLLAPAGRLAVAVWDQPAKSPFLTIGGGAVAQFFPPAPPDPKAPGGFRFSQPGALEALLRAAGFRDIAVESRPMEIDLASPTEYWEVFTDMAAGIKDKLSSLSDADLGQLKTMVDEAARPYRKDGRLRLVATPLCASAW